MRDFIDGATMLADLAVALFFLRFWRQTRDRLLLIFSIAFTVFAANRIMFASLDETGEGGTALYVVRLVAFLLIIAAIVDKNRGRD